MTNTNLKQFASVPAASTEQIDYLLLDGSSSMDHQWWEVLGALDAYIAETASRHVKSRVILATFDGQDLHYQHRDVNIADWIPFSKEPIGSFGGGTPLYDAIGEMGRKLRDLNPSRASIVIATDGGENGSRFTDQVQARAIINWMKAKGWQVTFIGCNWNNESLAKSLGVSPSAAIGVEKRHLTSAAKSLAEKRARYGHGGAPMHWSDDEKNQFGGYLK